MTVQGFNPLNTKLNPICHFLALFSRIRVKKCCISNAVDGTDDVLWNGSNEDGNVMNVMNLKALTENGDSDTDW
jgi:hypothetical protein